MRYDSINRLIGFLENLHSLLDDLQKISKKVELSPITNAYAIEPVTVALLSTRS